MVNKSKIKGDRFEREIRAKFESAGLNCDRIGLRSQAGQHECGDLVLNNDLIIECKKRAGCFKKLYSWLEKDSNTGQPPDMLIVSADRKSPLVVLPLDLFTIIVNKYYS